MRDVVVGTAGHIDHGKTLLVKALTGMDADRWEEEKRRGITLDIGFATLTRERGTLHFVDLPGHERFIKNMLAGATGIDLCLLVVAADESVMPQTVEHAEILSLLGVTRGVVALTKVDLVDAETREMALLELSEFLEAHGLSALPVVPVSAVTGEGLPALERALFDAAASCPEAPAGRPFRLPVDRVFPVKGFGTVVTGTCIDGGLSLGAEVEVYPGAGRSRVRGLQVFGRPVEAVRAGQRSAVNIPDLAHESLHRGHLLADPGTVWPTRLLFARFHLLPSARKALRTGTVGTLHIHTQEVEAHVHLAGLAALEPGGEAVAQIRLLEEAAAWPGDRFIFRLPSPQRTVAGGEVLLPAARKARWRRAREGRILEALRAGRLLEALLLEAGPLGVSPAEVRSRLGLREGQEIPLRAGEPAPARWAAGTWWLHPSEAEAWIRRALAYVEARHAEAPLALVPRREAAGRWLRVLGEERALALVEALAASGKVEAEGDGLRPAGRKVALSPAQKAAWDGILAALAAPSSPIRTGKELEEELGAEVRKVLPLLVSERRLVRFGGDFFLLPATLERLKGILAERRAGGQELLGVPEFKEILGITRKYAMPLLEYLDDLKWTRRQGEGRKILL
jgi:selenocysteine-specific elongation factor